MMNPRRLLNVGLLLGMLVAYWFLFAQDHLSQIRSAQSAIRSLRPSLIASEAATVRLDEMQGQADEASAWLERLQAHYVEEPVSSDFLRDVADTLEACELVATSTAPDPVQELSPFTTLAIHVVVEGELGSIFEFLHRMETARPPRRVTKLRVGPGSSSGEVRADLTVLKLWKGA